MSPGFRISNISAEGFRGINDRLNIDLDGNAAVLFGPNGVGKSSVMQAIEWCLFGGLVSAVLGPIEFKKEDAIVNSFHAQKKATVEVILQDEKGKKVRIIRERKQGKSTTAGKSDLKVEVKGTEYSGDEAQSELNKLLKLTPTEFYASVYLHQEAIRDLIVGDPLLRSEVIDKLLGLHFVRELIDYLPLKHVAKEAKSIEEEIGDIKDRKMQEVVISRKRLAESEAEMEKSGVESSKLNLASLAELFEKSSEDVNAIAERVKTKVKELEEPIHDLSSSEKALGQLKKTINELEKVWVNAYKEKVGVLSDFKNVKQNYDEALSAVASLETRDPKALITTRSEILDQISKMEKELKTTISARRFLQDESGVVRRLDSEFEEVRGELEGIKREFGNKAQIEESLRKLGFQIDEKLRSIEREESLGSILVSGLDYLKNTSPRNCPLCKSDIEYQAVISTLEKEIGERESAKIVRKLQNESEELTRQKTRIERARDALVELEDQRKDVESRIDEEKKKLRKSGFEPTEDLVEYADGELERLNTQVSDMDERIRTLKSEEAQVSLKLEELEKKIQKLGSVEKQAQGLVGAAETGDELVDLLSERIDELARDIKALEGITEDIRTAKEDLEACEKILGFLQEKDRVDQLEKGMPTLQKRLQDLEKKYSEIKELETGLTDIFEAASTAREEMVKKALAELQSAIGSCYSKILCHPYFVNLQLIPEEERGKAVYRIRAWDKDFKQGTFVQTRFSNAQMNAVALSLFLSMSSRLESSLGLILLDDPSQSMDKAHKEALSKLLSEILEDKQVFVATQDTEFEQWLEKSLGKTKTKIYQFQKWDTKGPKISL